MMRFVFLLLLCANLALTQTRDPAALLRQAATLEAAKKWDNAADAYSAAGDALMAAGRAGEAAAALKKAAQMSEQAADAILNGPGRVAPQARPAANQPLPAPARAVQAPAVQAAPANVAGAPVTIPAGQEFQSARQCTPGTPVRIASGPGTPNGGTGTIAAAAAADDLLCTVAVNGGGSQRIIYWRLASADPNARPIEHVTIPPGAELKSSNECTPGRAVTVGENLPYDDGGPGVIVRAVDNLTCVVTMTKTGKQNNVIYWRLAPQGAVAHYPDRVPTGNYGCGTFAGIVSLNSNIAGRPEARPLWDVHVTGPNTYTGSDGSRGTFTYDKTKGEVRFSGGSHNGRTASFLDNGGRGQFVFKGENGQIDCGL
jgi:hypothetical protein